MSSTLPTDPEHFPPLLAAFLSVPKGLTAFLKTLTHNPSSSPDQVSYTVIQVVYCTILAAPFTRTTMFGVVH